MTLEESCRETVDIGRTIYEPAAAVYAEWEAGLVRLGFSFVETKYAESGKGTTKYGILLELTDRPADAELAEILPQVEQCFPYLPVRVRREDAPRYVARILRRRLYELSGLADRLGAKVCLYNWGPEVYCSSDPEERVYKLSIRLGFASENRSPRSKLVV